MRATNGAAWRTQEAQLGPSKKGRSGRAQKSDATTPETQSAEPSASAPGAHGASDGSDEATPLAVPELIARKREGNRLERSGDPGSDRGLHGRLGG